MLRAPGLETNPQASTPRPWSWSPTAVAGRTQSARTAIFGVLAITVLAGCGSEGYSTDDQGFELQTASEEPARPDIPIVEESEISLSQSPTGRQQEVRATTFGKYGTVIDWVLLESQTTDGIVVSPPPSRTPAYPYDRVVTELEEIGAVKGPPGTVPIVRSIAPLPPKQGPASGEGAVAAPTAIPPITIKTHDHWYGGAIETATTYGAQGIISVGSPYIYRSDEFSLGRLALARGAGTQKQTIEVGWMTAPENGDLFPHLFIYYTTNGYQAVGDYIGGYNEDYDGWVQVSNTVSPGAVAVSGTELLVDVRLWNGDWWISVNGEWMGYYPGTLFNSTGIKNWADRASWYGEVTDYIADSVTTYTTMGTGFFPSSPQTFGAAYMRNLKREVQQGYLVNMNPGPLDPALVRPECWNGLYWAYGTGWETHISYGGNGNFSFFCF